MSIILLCLLCLAGVLVPEHGYGLDLDVICGPPGPGPRLLSVSQGCGLTRGAASDYSETHGDQGGRGKRGQGRGLREGRRGGRKRGREGGREGRREEGERTGEERRGEDRMAGEVR